MGRTYKVTESFEARKHLREMAKAKKRREKQAFVNKKSKKS